MHSQNHIKKKTGNIFTAGLKLCSPFYFWWINGDHFASYSKSKTQTWKTVNTSI